MTSIKSEIIGYGHYLPEKTLTNDDLSKIVETNDEWITERTGIKVRHIAANDEFTSDLATKAALNALQSANMNANDVDLIITGTITPDNTTPSLSAKIAGKLKMRPGAIAFDVGAACSGFVYALTMADNMIKLGQAKTAIVIGAETLSKLTDWTDRNTCVLFGDGAGAVVLKASADKGDNGILSTGLFADGSMYEYLMTKGGAGSTKTVGTLWMDGREVFKSAIGCLSQAAVEVINTAGLKLDDIKWFIPHQANVRIIEGVAKKLNIDESRVIITVDHHGNTSAASIPLALSESILTGKIKKGDLVVLNAMGAGFTWAGAVVRI